MWFAAEPIRKTLMEIRAENQIYGNFRQGSPRGPWSKKTGLAVNTTIWEPEKWPSWSDGPCTFMRGDVAQIIARTARYLILRLPLTPVHTEFISPRKFWGDGSTK